MLIERRVSTQDISWFIDLYVNGQLDIDPPYQRRSVWSPKDRRFFLDTIFRGYPSPSIFLHKQVADGKTKYFVVDGKQRLETIFRFANNKIAIDKKFGDTRLDGKRWKSIKIDPDLSKLFYDYVIPVEVTNITETGLINQVFDRLNRNSIKLVDQELRHAKYEGWFISFVEQQSDDPDWERLGVVTTARAKRMRDVQFISELLIVQLKGEVTGFDQEEINIFYAQYEDISDLEIPFNEQACINKFSATKDYLLCLENDAGIIKRFASDFVNLYSLWAVVNLKLDSLPTPKEFGQKYGEFMLDVAKYGDEEYLKGVTEKTIKPSFQHSFQYYQNSIGASTEPPQRLARHEALIATFFPEV